MLMSHFICQTLWNTSFEVVFQTIISHGWQVTESQWQYRQDSDGGGACEQMCTMHAGVMLCIVCVTMLPDRVDDSFTSTICLYLSPSQLCLITRMSNFKVTYLNLVDSYSTFF